VEVSKILEEIGRMEKKDLDSKVYGQGENHYRWPLGLAILLLLFEFLWPEVRGHWRGLLRGGRVGRLLAGAGVMLAFISGQAQALGRYPRSSELAPLVQKSPGNPEAQFNLAHALYIEQSYAAAAEAYEKTAAALTHPPSKSAALYNAGNAYYRQGKLEEAIKKYKEALRITPSDMDAKHNLEMAKKLDKMQKDQQKQKGKPKEDQKTAETRRDVERRRATVVGSHGSGRKKCPGKGGEEKTRTARGRGLVEYCWIPARIMPEWDGHDFKLAINKDSTRGREVMGMMLLLGRWGKGVCLLRPLWRLLPRYVLRRILP
jgi:tetratricopeptide (TPR) repeat protein